MVTCIGVIHFMVVLVGVLKNVRAQNNCHKLGQDGCPPTVVVGNGKQWGKIHSLGYPHSYPADHYVWKIACDKTATRLVFDDFDLEPSDSIEVYRGLKKMITFWGSSGKRPVYEDSHNDLSLLLRITSPYHFTRRGFALTFQCFEAVSASLVWRNRPVTSDVRISAGYSHILTIPSSPEISHVDTIITLDVPKGYNAIHLRILQNTYLRGVVNGWSNTNFFEVHQGDSVSGDLADKLTFADPRDLDTSTYLHIFHQSVLTLRVRGSFERHRKLSLLVTALSTKDCRVYTDQFRCNSGVCIAKTLVSNGYWNCPYGSDEDCGGFLCYDRSACLSIHHVCDGVSHCSDRSDELQKCAVATTAPPKHTDDEDESMPTVLFIGALGIIGCLLLAIIFVMMRRRVIRCDKICNHRESRRTRGRASPRLSVTVNNIASSGQGHPPTYDEAVLYNHVTGNINFAFSSDDPPAYETIIVPPVEDSPPEYSTLDRRGLVLSAIALYNTNPLNDHSPSTSSTVTSDSLANNGHSMSSSPPGRGIHGTDCVLSNMNLVRNSSSQTRSVEPVVSDGGTPDQSGTVNQVFECSELGHDLTGQSGGESCQGAAHDGDDGTVIILASSDECHV